MDQDRVEEIWPKAGLDKSCHARTQRKGGAKRMNIQMMHGLLVGTPLGPLNDPCALCGGCADRCGWDFMTAATRRVICDDCAETTAPGLFHSWPVELRVAIASLVQEYHQGQAES